MDSVLLEAPTMAAAQSLSFNSHNLPNLESVINESIQRFLVEIGKQSPDFSAFRSVFSRLLQSSVDPPLEIIWLYSAVTFHETVVSRNDAFALVNAIRNLLQLLSACSVSCNGVKSIALLAPAVSELYYCFLASKKLNGKEEKKVKKEIESLIEAILSYISICSSKCSNWGDFGDAELLPGFSELVRVWTVKHCTEESGNRVIFPLISDEIRDGFVRDRANIGYLAGVVVTEAFLLRLCLKVQNGAGLKQDLQKELRIWAVSSISVFQNWFFFEILLNLLLEPALPVLSLLDVTDETLVRDILYDALILVDYSFINHGVAMDQSDNSLSSIFLTRLFVTHEAIQIARNKGDQGKAMSYMSAFSTCSVPTCLIKYVISRSDFSKFDKPKSSTPQAILKWLVEVEESGVRLFGDKFSKIRKKLINNEQNAFEGTNFNSVRNQSDAELFFFDKKGENNDNDNNDSNNNNDDDMDMIDSAFMEAARNMKSTTNSTNNSNGRRKREELGADDEADPQVRFVKYKIHDNSMKDYFSFSSSGSEVENPSSDDEMDGSD